MSGFKCAVDDQKRATELALLRCQGTAGENPQIRGFWGATLSFFLAFLGWFALAPLSVEVATSMGECENQRFPPEARVGLEVHETNLWLPFKRGLEISFVQCRRSIQLGSPTSSTRTSLPRSPTADTGWCGLMALP